MDDPVRSANAVLATEAPEPCTQGNITWKKSIQPGLRPVWN